MKKLLSVFLTITMLVSAVSVMSFGASAEEVIVPKCVFAQNTTPVDNKQNIRFVSEVAADVVDGSVDALGYDVIAVFKKDGAEKEISYNIEGTEVYSSLIATVLGTENVVEAKDNTYFFALTITDVPTDLGDVYLYVKTYSKVGEEKTYADGTSRFCFVSGKGAVYGESFNVDSKYADLAWGSTGYATAALDASIANDKLTVNNKWASGTFVNDAKMAGIDKYTLEGDINLTHATSALFNVIFNADCATGNMLKNVDNNWMVLSFRPVDSTGKMNAKATDTNIGVSLFTFTSYAKSGGGYGANQYNVLGTNTFVPLTNAAYGEEFHLKMVVDNTTKTIEVFVNGTSVLKCQDVVNDGTAVTNIYKNGATEPTVSANKSYHMVNTSTAIGIWVQTATSYIDNLKVTK